MDRFPAEPGRESRLSAPHQGGWRPRGPGPTSAERNPAHLLPPEPLGEIASFLLGPLSLEVRGREAAPTALSVGRAPGGPRAAQTQLWRPPLVAACPRDGLPGGVCACVRGGTRASGVYPGRTGRALSPATGTPPRGGACATAAAPRPHPLAHSHLVPLLVVGQDLGHVPVPGGDGLDVVVAAVGLEQTGRCEGRDAGPPHLPARPVSPRGGRPPCPQLPSPRRAPRARLVPAPPSHGSHRDVCLSGPEAQL